MTKGGFVAEMLASRKAGTSDVKYIWHYLYYIYLGLPALVIYWSLYMYMWYYLVGMLSDLLGVAHLGKHSWGHFALSLAVSLGFSLALFHFKLLPYLFAPVKLITSV